MTESETMKNVCSSCEINLYKFKKEKLKAEVLLNSENNLKEKYLKLVAYAKKRSYLDYDNSFMNRLKIQKPLAYHQIMEARELLQQIGEQ